ncbi:MAG: bifunctional phosphopantothenoylcysteine decarboxylase/phosphopantothenate--cysteine ligase CoaBC [Deltaproteobacteria bacterium]|nr:MAG: bifunctional phosphopantothenoylcysteine decarboxylase/phosphopantothenate--cysteine ligase CoaBC [Deltaproteobacteria bacterium]
MARVLLVVSAGIAAYKAPELVRRLRGAGHEVRVCRTRGAAAFVTDLSLAVVSGHPVASELFDPTQEVAGLDPAEDGPVGHIALADWPDVVLVAPATADLLARAAGGLADDLPTTILLATRAPVLFAPAMNVNMWQHPATQDNVARLRSRGAHFVGPDAGQLACGWEGPGRLADLDTLVAAVETLASARHTWAGRRVLVTAGPTRTPLDAVRFVTNASTGTMGFSVAAEAARRGAEVHLVTGPVHLETPPGVVRVDVTTTRQMHAAVMSALEDAPFDVAVMTAAVGDLEIDGAAEHKLPKDALARFLGEVRIDTAPDILADACARFGDRVLFVGFAAETLDDDGPGDAALVAKARAKRDRKGCHVLFANRVDLPDRGFGPGENAGVLLVDDEVCWLDRPRPKPAVAAWLLDRLEPLVGIGGDAA